MFWYVCRTSANQVWLTYCFWISTSFETCDIYGRWCNLRRSFSRNESYKDGDSTQKLSRTCLRRLWFLYFTDYNGMILIYPANTKIIFKSALVGGYVSFQEGIFLTDYVKYTFTPPCTSCIKRNVCRLVVGIGGLWPECSLDGIWWLNSSSREIRNAKTWEAWLKSRTVVGRIGRYCCYCWWKRSC